MKTIIILTAATSILTGCLTVPKTSTDLVESSSTTEAFCYDIPNEIIEERIFKYMSSCYHPVELIIQVGGAMVPMDASFQVIQEKLPNGKRYSVRNFIGFGFSANVIPNINSCKTKITMYGISGLWKKHFSPLDLQAQGKDSECPV